MAARSRKRTSPRAASAPASTSPDAGAEVRADEQTAEPAQLADASEQVAAAKDAGDDRTTDYARAGGHVLTDMGWVLEDQVEALGAKPVKIEQE